MPVQTARCFRCHLPGYLTPGYLTGCQIPGYLMENIRVFVNTPVMWHHKTGVLKNTRVFFVKYPDIFQYPGYMTLHRGITASGLRYPYWEFGCMISVVLESTYVISNILLVAISLDRDFLITMSYSKYVKLQTLLRIRLQIDVCCCIGILSVIIELCLWNFAKTVSVVVANIDFDVYCLYPPRRMKGYGPYGHNSGIPYTPYPFRVRIRVRDYS